MTTINELKLVRGFLIGAFIVEAAFGRLDRMVILLAGWYVGSAILYRRETDRG